MIKTVITRRHVSKMPGISSPLLYLTITVASCLSGCCTTRYVDLYPSHFNESTTTPVPMSIKDIYSSANVTPPKVRSHVPTEVELALPDGGYSGDSIFI